MNKYQEAFESISDNNYQYGTDEQWELLKELVDKETPEKPFHDAVETEDGEEVEIRVCPNCSETVNFIVNFPYCPYCGQKLLWEDE